MAREFNVSTGNATLQGSLMLVFLHSSGAPAFNIEILRWWCGQAANATSAQQFIRIESQLTSFPTLTSATPASLKRQDANVSTLVGSTNGFAGTAGVNSSTDNAGSKTQILDDAFNVLNGWLQVPTPPETIVAPAGYASGVGMRTPTSVATTTGWAFGCQFREV
jgi:hypothetical protein